MKYNLKQLSLDRLVQISRELQQHVNLQKIMGTDFLPVPEIEPIEVSDNIQTVDKSKLLENLRNEANNCKRCTLAESRMNVVFGTGSENARLMFIGEAPGYHEDRTGIPFVGKAGQLLTKIIQAIGLTRKEVYIANILKCRPPGNRNPTLEEGINCYPYLVRQIELIKPEIIVALGGVSGKKLLKTNRPTGQLRGEFHDFQGAKLIVTYHPAYLLRNPADKRKTWEDMKKVRDCLGLNPTVDKS